MYGSYYTYEFKIRSENIIMKKIDKLILKAFVAPFFMTFFVAVFILLMQMLLRYFNELVGKDLGVDVLSELFFYLGVVLSPQAFPLAVLLASLMTFGNLGEHFELTAIKASGISLLRALLPIFVFSLLLTVGVYYSNSYLVPKAALKAYSLLYDVKQKKAAMQLQEGSFYSDLPGYKIKINKKYPNGGLKDVIIYDHSKGTGNKSVILADSGKMYTIKNGAYLTLELFKGNQYSEESPEGTSHSNIGKKGQPLTRTKFSKIKIVFSLASFQLGNTDENLFTSNRMVMSAPKLAYTIDSLQRDLMTDYYEGIVDAEGYFNYHLNKIEVPEEIENKRRKQEILEDKLPDALAEQKSMEIDSQILAQLNQIQKLEEEKDTQVDSIKEERIAELLKNEAKSEDSLSSIQQLEGLGEEASVEEELTGVALLSEIDSTINSKNKMVGAINYSISKARSVKSNIDITANKLKSREKYLLGFEIEWIRKIAGALSCLIMFFIGAPLGSIIKKGGLGVPVLFSIAFFILYYVFNVLGEKWAKEDLVSVEFGIWLADIVLLPVGMFFLIQAYRDARIFEADYYTVLFKKIKGILKFK